MVEPVEEYLEYLRAQQASPNTVKSYARALALWWQYLDAFDLRWDSVTLEGFGAFLTWLRTGDEPEVSSIERRPARFAESTIAARLAAVISCYDYHVLNGVDVGRDLHRITHRGGSRYKPLLEHRAAQRPSSGSDPRAPPTPASATDPDAPADRAHLCGVRELGQPDARVARVCPRQTTVDGSCRDRRSVGRSFGVATS
jgi:hypothetical protein